MPICKYCLQERTQGAAAPIKGALLPVAMEAMLQGQVELPRGSLFPLVGTHRVAMAHHLSLGDTSTQVGCTPCAACPPLRML